MDQRISQFQILLLSSGGYGASKDGFGLGYHLQFTLEIPRGIVNTKKKVHSNLRFGRANICIYAVHLQICTYINILMKPCLRGHKRGHSKFKRSHSKFKGVILNCL